MKDKNGYLARLTVEEKRQWYKRVWKNADKSYYKRYQARLREEMFEAYGHVCACCGEDEKTFLTLDHINGDGAEDQRKRKAAPGYGLFLSLKKDGWPSGYQVLCYNCNCAKRTGDECPHRLIVRRKLMRLAPRPV